MTVSHSCTPLTKENPQRLKSITIGTDLLQVPVQTGAEKLGDSSTVFTIKQSLLICNHEKQANILRFCHLRYEGWLLLCVFCCLSVDCLWVLNYWSDKTGQWKMSPWVLRT